MLDVYKKQEHILYLTAVSCKGFHKCSHTVALKKIDFMWLTQNSAEVQKKTIRDLYNLNTHFVFSPLYSVPPQ